MSSSAPLAAAPTATPAVEEPPPVDGWRDAPPDLAALRAQLDDIDDSLQDLLIRRARVVESVAKSGKPAALRPGREASILRRLVARHQGSLPRQALYRVWRELLAATTGMQGGFSLAVCDAHPGGAYTQLAREQYGALTPLRVHGTAAQAIAELSAGTAAVAVLPMPSETETWWRTALLHPQIHVVARLPFWATRPEGSPAVQALVVARFEPDASGQDRSFIGLELAQDVSRARLTSEMTAAGFAPGAVLMQRDPAGVTHALVEVDGHVTAEDPRLDRLSALRHPLALGGYAVPLEVA